FLAKVKVVGAAVLLVAALGLGGVAYHSEAVWAGQTEQASKAKPRSELEALRRENELLKLNLEVVLEKVRAQEAELRALRGKAAHFELGLQKAALEALAVEIELKVRPDDVAARQAEAALKALREAKDDPSRR